LKRGGSISNAITLLRYPGGKSRAIKYLKEYIPKDTKEICSPFFGGGAFELYLAKQGIKVYGYDSFRPLVEFWKNVLNNPDQLIDEIYKYYPLDKDIFYQLQQKILNANSSIEVAAMFFVLNRSSYSGLTLSGGMSPNHPRFTINSIEKIRGFKMNNLIVECMDFKDSIRLHRDKFLYCDPPYYIESNNLYGVKGDKHKRFNHLELFEVLKNHNNWMLSYNNHEYIRELYKDYKQIQLDWSYGTSRNNSSKPKELLVLNIN